MTKFWDNWWVGIMVGLACVMVMVILFNWGYQIGHQYGWEHAVREVRGEEGGIYISVSFEGSKSLKGFVK